MTYDRVLFCALASAAIASAAAGQCQSGATAACDEPRATVSPARYIVADKDIVDTAVAAGNFKTLAAALKAAGLVGTLKGEGPFTVFAPTDEAFAKLPAGTVESLLKPENKDKLIAILTYHVVPGRVAAADVASMTTGATVNGQRIDIASRGGGVQLDGRANVTSADIECANGIIHVIDTVIMPSTRNIVETAGDAGSFSTLLAAAKAAGLAEALQGKGPFTIFAPTDEAFAKLPKGTVESLLKPENKGKLAAILSFHVIPGRVYADDIVRTTRSPRTLQGSTFDIAVTIGNAKARAGLTATDIEASNGVIHVIDTVIMPD